MVAESRSSEPSAVAEAVLADLPDELWTPVLRAFRRAADQLGRGELPASVRPFAGWKPEALTAPHPRRVLARALAGDDRLREAVAAQLGAADELAAATAGVEALVAAEGVPMAAALLVVTERWEDLAVLSGEAVERSARRRHDAELAALRRESRTAEEARVRLEDDIAFARTQREQLRRRAVAAESRADAAAGELDDLRTEVARLRERVHRLERELETARERSTRRLRSARARAERAEERARADIARARELAKRLSTLTAELHAALDPPAAPEGESGSPGGSPGLPRAVSPARPGRPCGLPPGLSTDGPEGVLAILGCAQLGLVLDGYNVTKHVRGLPRGTLEQQRRWLVRIAGGVAARFGVRVTVAFDGAEVGPLPARSPRGVQVAFSAPGETADDLIVTLIDSRPAAEPVMVVTDDRELRGRVRERDADVAGVEPFLLAVGA